MESWEGSGQIICWDTGVQAVIGTIRVQKHLPSALSWHRLIREGPLIYVTFVTVSSVENNVVLDAVKFPDLDSFDSLTRSTYTRHDDNWMKLGRAC